MEEDVALLTTRFLDTTSYQQAIDLAILRLKLIHTGVKHVRVVEFSRGGEEDTSRYLVYPLHQTGKALLQMRTEEDMFEVVADVVQDPEHGIQITSPYRTAAPHTEDHDEERTERKEARQ